MSAAPAPARRRAALAATVFTAVLAAQLVLVAGVGTDIPWHDQWDAEGRGLYPALCDGTLGAADLLRPHNEHRIAWTHALNLALFALNGQWDPLVQLAAAALVRAAAAAGLVWCLTARIGPLAAGAITAGVTVAFLPHLAWHNALWGFQSQVYFSLLFSLAALALLGAPEPNRAHRIGGCLAGVAALGAMGAGALVPVALLGLTGLRALERRRWEPARWRETLPAVGLLAAAWLLHADVPEHAALRATSFAQWGEAFLQVLAWPHVGQPLAALGLNLPLVWAVTSRVARRRPPAAGEDFVLLLGSWAVALAAATAWSRGAAGELAGAVPSRYVDFVVLLPLANAWCAAAWWRRSAPSRRRLATTVAAAWGVFLFVGWLGLSAQTLRRILIPRWQDRDAPVRIAQAYQTTGDASGWARLPRLLVPHPNPESVHAVLHDPRLRGALPPSLQPERPPGPLSRAVRTLLGRQ